MSFFWLLKVGYETIQKLIKLRGSAVHVLAGETDGNGYGASMVRKAMGRRYGDQLYGNALPRSAQFPYNLSYGGDSEEYEYTTEEVLAVLAEGDTIRV